MKNPFKAQRTQEFQLGYVGYHDMHARANQIALSGLHHAYSGAGLYQEPPKTGETEGHREASIFHGQKSAGIAMRSSKISTGQFKGKPKNKPGITRTIEN